MKHIVTIFAALSIVGCIGPSPSLDIAEVGSMPAQIVRRAWAVQVTDALPIGATTLGPVEGTSCKNKAWDPQPSEIKALEQLQIKAVEAGATGLTEVLYVKHEFSMVTNCWATITASAMAYR
jgi:hypothetical protein